MRYWTLRILFGWLAELGCWLHKIIITAECRHPAVAEVPKASAQEQWQAEIRDHRARYKNASPDIERELLRMVMESKARRAKDHTLFPGR